MHPSLRHRPEDFYDPDDHRRLRRLSWLLAAGLATALTLLVEPASADPNFEKQLFQKASQWLKGGNKPAHPSSKPEDFTPIDERIRPNGCHSPIVFDQPFAHRPGKIRARCESPKWTVFLNNQVLLPQQASPEASRPLPAAAPTHRVLVAKANIPANQPIDPSQFEIREIPLGGPLRTYFTTAQGLEFSTVARAIYAGKPLRATDVRPSVLIKRGQPVTLAVETIPGLNISVKMTAMEDGRYGQQIRLQNIESGKTTTGMVIGWAQAGAR